LKTLDWDAELLAAFDIPRAVLPEVRSSSEVYGEATLKAIAGVPVTGILGDQRRRWWARRAFVPGEVKTPMAQAAFC